jgi:hypothetical protein
MTRGAAGNDRLEQTEHNIDAPPVAATAALPFAVPYTVQVPIVFLETWELLAFNSFVALPSTYAQYAENSQLDTVGVNVQQHQRRRVPRGHRRQRQQRNA